MEDERFKIFLEVLLRYREWEDDKIHALYAYPGQASLPSSQLANQKDPFCLRGAEYVYFKPLKDP